MSERSNEPADASSAKLPEVPAPTEEALRVAIKESVADADRIQSLLERQFALVDDDALVLRGR